MVYHAHCIDLLVGDMNYLVQRVLSAREHVDLLEGWANRSASLSLFSLVCVCSLRNETNHFACSTLYF